MKEIKQSANTWCADQIEEAIRELGEGVQYPEDLSITDAARRQFQLRCFEIAEMLRAKNTRTYQKTKNPHIE
jgi:hypothetical protein